MELPADFILRTRALLGSEYNEFETALNDETPVSIRLNSKKALASLPAEDRIPWCNTGYYLTDRPTFTFDPLFHAGGYYAQEASSMFLEQVIKTYVENPVRCLDLCAAPGGKSTHLLDVLPEGSLLVSNEVIRNRSVILSGNMAKWGAPNVVVCNEDPEKLGLLTHYFDVIVTDVPCSGEGMFRKDEDSRKEWSVANVELCASRQRRILNDIWDALKPGGLLIYSTCTYNTEEDEDNIRYIADELGAEALALPIPASWKISGALKGNLPAFRFFPHKTKGEGFFLSILRKTGEETHPVRFKARNNKDHKKEIIPEEFRKWLDNPEEFIFNTHHGIVEAFPARHKEDYALLTSKLKIVSAGVRIGESKGKDLIPHPALALSYSFGRSSFPETAVDWENAIRFLRKEAIGLPPSTEKGYRLITHKGLPLGFIKHLGNRSNNLYPSEWRIRSGYTPEEIKTV